MKDEVRESCVRPTKRLSTSWTRFTVAGKQPARGEYKVEWSGVGLSSQVTFSKDGRIAVATASVRDRSNPCGGPAVAAGPAGNGRKVLEAIDLPKQAIILRAGRDDTEVTL